jgi:CheY-like chemotaxis protein/Tfp pilus assembly protein PilZ
MKNILIVDSDPIMVNTLEGLLNSQGGFISAQSVKNGKLALETIAEDKIHLVITGPSMSETDSFGLVAQLSQHHPDIRIIVMTAGASPMFRTKMKKMHSAVHFEQSMDVGLLTKRIFTELSIDYGGQVRGIGLSSFLQMMELERRSCSLQISAKGKLGYLFISHGDLVDANVGLLFGKRAALEILTWQNVSIDIDYFAREFEKAITTPLMGLLLESGRIADEKLSQRPDQRRHDRFECLVAVDYDINDWTYQCYLRDLSLGGAYIETAQPLEIGKKIILSLSSPELAEGCAINAVVVRKDKKGIGVTFKKISLRQKQVIETLTAGAHPFITEVDQDVVNYG